MCRKIVITGPTGAVGMALIQKCIENKAHVLALCHKGSKRISNIPHSPYVTVREVELSKLQEINPAEGETYDAFFHLGWVGTTGEGRNDMQLQCKNIEYTIEAVKLAARFGCHTFIGAGSQAEYGRVEGKLTPKTPAFPENGYGMAKLCAGQMSRALCEKYGIKHIWVRILSVYGPFDGENTMISSTIKKLLSGGHAGFTPGEQEWDYLYSEDAAEALWRLSERGISGKVYVLGSGEKKPLAEYIGELHRAVAEAVPEPGTLGIGELPYAPKQVMCLCADIAELTADTGFLPETSFTEGIRRTVNGILEMQ